MIRPILMQFPLRGEWNTPNTPGTRIPSHGTNAFASRYAYDFVQLDWKRRGRPCYRVSPLHYLIAGVPVEKCYCYEKPIYAPCDGIITAVENHWPQRKKAVLFSDLQRAKRNSRFPLKTDGDIRTLCGNYIILKHSDSIYAAFCHLQPHTACVIVGQKIQKGDLLGYIGHTGNSMFPHLHFQLMNSADFTLAHGLPCAFDSYECYEKGSWHTKFNAIPKAEDHIRFLL